MINLYTNMTQLTNTRSTHFGFKHQKSLFPIYSFNSNIFIVYFIDSLVSTETVAKKSYFTTQLFLYIFYYANPKSDAPH